MKREMRRKDRLIGQEECIDILKHAEFGSIATSDSDGYPYITPMNFVYFNDALYFHCSNAGGHKLDNIKTNPKVCFNVIDSVQLLPEKFSTKYSSVIVFGKIKIVEDKNEKLKAIAALVEKLCLDYLEEGNDYINAAIDDIYMLKLEIDEMTGKAAK